MRIFRKTLVFVFCLLSFLGCNRQNLYIQSEYITYEDLASYHAGSPDPRKECPDTGQRLLVYWSLPKHCFVPEKSILTLLLRYGNGSERNITINLKRASGLFTYDLFNEEYFCQEGILTYKAYITIENQLVEEWFHQIWTDKIDFSS